MKTLLLLILLFNWQTAEYVIITDISRSKTAGYYYKGVKYQYNGKIDSVSWYSLKISKLKDTIY